MFRKLIIAGLAAATAFGMNAALPSPASATPGTITTYTFTAGATVSNPIFAPGLGPSAPVGTSWSFNTETPGLAGVRVCWGTMVSPNGVGVPTVEAALRVNGTNVVGTGCQLAANGTLGAGLTGLGVFCGNSSGSGTINVANVNGVVSHMQGATVSWLQSAGTVLPLVISGGPYGVLGTGAVQTTGAAPGTCGVGGGTTSFAVTGFVAAVSTA